MMQIEVEIDSKKKFIDLDTNEHACRPYGFLSGNRIFLPEGGAATVLGVGRPVVGTGNVLWYKKDENGKLGYWGTASYESRDLRDHGFRPIA